MNKVFSLGYLISLGLLLVCGDVSAQSVRSYVNKGVDLYKGGKYVGSEV